MGFLLLRPQDLKDLISMKEGIDVVELSYRQITDFPVINAPRRRVHSPASFEKRGCICIGRGRPPERSSPS